MTKDCIERLASAERIVEMAQSVILQVIDELPAGSRERSRVCKFWLGLDNAICEYRKPGRPKKSAMKGGGK